MNLSSVFKGDIDGILRKHFDNVLHSTHPLNEKDVLDKFHWLVVQQLWLTSKILKIKQQFDV